MPRRTGLTRYVALLLTAVLVTNNVPLQVRTRLETGTWTPEAATIALAAANTTMRVSVTAAGAEANADSFTWDGDASPVRTVSDDGRYVVFRSNATNLPGGAAGNVYVRDTVANTTILVSVTQTGTPAGGGWPTISGDGRYVTFNSANADIVPGDTNGAMDVFVRDLVAGTTVRASVDSSGTQCGGSESYLSRDGRTVAFAGGNCGGPAPGGGIYLRDLVANTTDFISIGNDGAVANDSVNQPSASDDGRYVSFVSRASNLSPIPKNNNPLIFDVYVRDRSAGTTVRASVGPGGVQGNGQSNTAVLSGDGRKVIFRSGAENLIAVDGNFAVDLFMRDLDAAFTTRIVELSDGGFISADGRYIAFESTATNLVAGDTNGTADVFLRDQQEGTTELISVSSTGGISNLGAWRATVTPDGRYVSFESGSSDLVTGDTGGHEDVFLRDRGPVDTGAAAPYTYGDDANGAYSDANVNLGTGVYTTEAVDLATPGRTLPLVFRRTYNSSDKASGPLGPAWSHSFYWRVVDAGSFVTLRRGDGERDTFARNVDGTYAAPPNVSTRS